MQDNESCLQTSDPVVHPSRCRDLSVRFCLCAPGLSEVRRPGYHCRRWVVLGENSQACIHLFTRCNSHEFSHGVHVAVTSLLVVYLELLVLLRELETSEETGRERTLNGACTCIVHNTCTSMLNAQDRVILLRFDSCFSFRLHANAQPCQPQFCTDALDMNKSCTTLDLGSEMHFNALQRTPTPLFTQSTPSGKSYLSDRLVVGVGSPRTNSSHPALTLIMYKSPIPAMLLPMGSLPSLA